MHICTGPVAVKGAEPGDILEVRILDVQPRPCANPKFKGKSFGSNAAAWWGFHFNDLIEEPKKREVITIYEIDASGERDWAKALYNFRWTPQTDPFGVVHKIIDYPGVPVDHSTIKENWGVLKNVRVPIRPHFGVMGLAPKEADMVDSIPPSYTGGNIDNWRIGKGATMYYPVSVPGALFSVGDPHASQGDSELCGTAIECSLTGTFQLILHKKATLAGTPLESLDYPLLETQTELLVHGFSYPNYLADLGAEGAVGDLLQVLGGPGAARRVPQDAPLPHDHAGTHRGRGDLADVGRRGLRRHPGGGRQLGRARDRQEGPVRGAFRLLTPLSHQGREGLAAFFFFVSRFPLPSWERGCIKGAVRRPLCWCM